MASAKKALVTGVTGQDGSYLVELLLEKGYDVYGLVRRSSVFNTERIDHLITDSHTEGPRAKNVNFFRIYGDLSDASSMARIIAKIKPDEIYNLGAQSHVRVSFDVPEYTCDANALGVLRILESIRDTEVKTKFYQASSSEMFGMARDIPQNENTPFYPRSPYGVSKVFGYWITRNYRESYNMFACNGILFNHESPRRGKTFVTKKTTRALARIKLGKQDCLYLGNLDAKRDWGYAKDYVEAMWLILQHKQPDDYVIATNESHSVREFIEECCGLLGIEIEWRGKGLDEVGIDLKTKKTIIRIDPYFFRPAEVELLQGDYSKAKRLLGWEPKVRFKQLIKIMLDYDLEEERTSPK